MIEIHNIYPWREGKPFGKGRKNHILTDKSDKYDAPGIITKKFKLLLFAFCSIIKHKKVKHYIKNQFICIYVQ